MGMEEEHPLEGNLEASEQEVPQQPVEQEATIVSEPVAASPAGEENETDAEDAAGMSHGHGRLLTIGIVVVVALIILGLFLPPVSLGERLGITGGDDTTATAQEETATAEPETEAVEDGDISVAVAGDVKVKTKKVTQEDFLNGEADDELGATAADMPENRTLVSDVYLLAYKDEAPEGSVSIAVSSAAQPYQTLDMMGWDGQAWTFVPSEANSEVNVLTSLSGPLPKAVTLMQTAAASELEIGAEVLPAHELPPPILPYLSEVTAGTLTLVQQGKLVGDIVEVPSSGYRQYARATNTGAIVDVQSLNAVLSDPAAAQSNIQQLVSRAAEGGFDGVNLDYQGVDPDQREEFTAFITDLSAALNAQKLGLIVTLETPVMVDGEWDTAGQDWPAIGQIASAVYLQMPLEPAAYGDDGEASQIVDWATRNVDRTKLSLLVSVNAIDAVADSA